MDKTEIIALGIVAVAALLLVLYYRKNKGSACGGECFSKMKKEKGEKLKDKE